jgi:hypothetical protein
VPSGYFDLLPAYACVTRSGLQATELQKQGWTIVDVRVADKYEKEHIEGSVSIPLFRPVQGDSVMDNVKRFVRLCIPFHKCVPCRVQRGCSRADSHKRDACIFHDS